jgi:hypothetical protein
MRETSIDMGACHQDGQPQAPSLAQPRPLAALDVRAAVVAARLSSALRGLHRLTIDACRAGRGRTSGFPANPRAPHRRDLRPWPVIAPRGDIIIPAAVGPQVMRQHGPWAAAPGQRHERVDDLSPGECPESAATFAARSRHQWLSVCPWCVRSLRWRRLPWLMVPRHAGVLLCSHQVYASFLSDFLSNPVSGESLRG